MEGSADRDESLVHALNLDPAHDEKGQDHPHGPEFPGAPPPVQPAVPVASEPARMTQAELWEACRSYAARTGAPPDAAAFVVHPAEAYGLVDPVTGGPLPATEVEELLARFPESRMAASVTGGVEASGPHPFFGPPSARRDVHPPAAHASVPGHVPAPAASAGDLLSAPERQQMSPSALTGPATGPAGEIERGEGEGQ
ncbi:hypothetical protein [Streptomyces sp. R33]|uniref:Uncharacterized protein n=1 Tax=Streptomyces sp. R33 TaxID=3238629 RepID=A0AB39XUD8_9ACTN